MAYAQSQFDKFHSNILFGYEYSQDLRERRDAVLADLSEKISEDAPSFTTFMQGSYALKTGTVPLNGNPDMDIGVLFDCTTTDYPDPLTLKKYVRDALTRTNRTVDIRRPCVTVTYLREGTPIHHIDFAVYCKNDYGQTVIAWCRETTTVAEREWKQSEAQQLTDTITERFSGKDRDQYRRCVRALKRWRDEKIGHKNVPSIGLTVAALNWFNPTFDPIDGKPRDLLALIKIVNSMIMNWGWTRLQVNLPVAPYSNLFEKMTDLQMAEFKTALIALRDALEAAHQQPDTHEACKLLRKQFGADFPVPEKVETTKSVTAGVSMSGRSA